MQDAAQDRAVAQGPQQRETLAFDDPGASRSKWVAAALILALVGWMGSGFLLPADNPSDETPAAEKLRAVTVAVRDSSAETVTRYFVAEGQAQPDRATTIRAETSGEVAVVEVEKGADVTAGQVLARIAPAQREADLARAEEELRRTRRDLDNAQTLLDRGTATVDRVAQARAAFAGAEAQLAAAQEALDNTIIRAPFDGRLEDLVIDEGEILSLGATVGEVVDNRPLTVVVRVPQQARGSLRLGAQAEVRFITGEVAEGQVSFIGTNADAATRTFAAEVTVENAEGGIPAGISAEIRVPTDEVVAHFMSPAVLSLGADGTLGVKTVDDENRVQFHDVQIVRAQTDGIWVSGLPERARIITVGQGYVRQGETVEPRPEGEIALAPLRQAGVPAGNASVPAEGAR